MIDIPDNSLAFDTDISGHALIREASVYVCDFFHIFEENRFSRRMARRSGRVSLISSREKSRATVLPLECIPVNSISTIAKSM